MRLRDQSRSLLKLSAGCWTLCVLDSGELLPPHRLQPVLVIESTVAANSFDYCLLRNERSALKRRVISRLVLTQLCVDDLIDEVNDHVTSRLSLTCHVLT